MPQESPGYRISDALKSVTDAIWVIAPDSTIVYLNDAANDFHADLCGTRPTVGLPVSDLYPSDVRARWTDRYRAAAEGKPVFTLEVMPADADDRYFELLFDRGSKTTTGYPVVVIARPITERHRTMIGMSLEARTIIDSDTYVLFACARFKQLLGISGETPIRSVRMRDLLDPDDEPAFLHAVSSATVEPTRLERLRFVTSGGEMHQVIGAIARIPDTGNLAVTFLDITDQIETERKLELQAEHLRALHAWAAELNVFIDRPELLYNRSLELLRNTVRYDSASVQVRDGDELRIVACVGFGEPAEVVGMRFPFDSKFPNWHVLTSREMVSVTDVSIDYPHFRSQADQFQSGSISAWLGVPLAVRDEVFGMIALDRAEPEPFTEEEQRLVTTMAGHISVAVHNARLFAALQESEKSLTDANDQKEVLLRELHHRSKNNMQMISSLLSLGAASVSVEEDSQVLDEVRMRIQSLAAIHEELYKADNLDQVDLAEYAKRLARMIAESYGRDGVGIRVNATALTASIDISVPFGLILSEMVLNAYKHAFPVGRSGTILVEVSRDDQGGLLVVQDDGIGLTRDDLEQATESLGMQLIHSLVEQIGGELDLTNEPGTKWIVRFPAPASAKDPS